MTSLGQTDRLTPDLRSYLAVLARRRWLLALFLVTVPLVAYFFAIRTSPVYESSSEVLLTRTAQGVIDITNPGFFNPDRAAETQVRLARVPAVAVLTLEGARLTHRNARGFLDNSAVTADDNSDLLTFTVRDGDPDLAERLATEYARQYIVFRNQLETAELTQARRAVETQIEKIENNRQTDSPLYASLVEKQQQLLTAEAVVSSSAKLVREADGTSQVEPRPMVAIVLGLVIGLVLGLGAAFLADTFDSRLRSADEIADLLGLPLLAQLPGSTRRSRAKRRLVMLNDPDGHEAESYRMLRTNLEFINLDSDARAIMVTSAVSEEGKSTTVANLAVAFARAGRHVLLVDLDLRRPTLDAFFGLSTGPGVTETMLGDVRLEDAIRQIPLDPASTNPGASRSLELAAPNARGHDHTKARAATSGSLEVLTSGAIPPNPGEYVTARALDTLLEQLRARTDILLIDGPPMLLTGDTLTLSAKVDAVIVAARAMQFRRPMARELTRLLAASPASKLGVVVTSSTSEVTRGYYHHYSSRERDRELVR